MNITFFVGNGFDINLGLNTRYTDFYPFFIKRANENNMIRSWISNKEKFWADLEEQLGQELIKLDVKNLDQYYLDKDELDSLLIDYLISEEQKYTYDENAIINEMNRSLINFTKQLAEQDVNAVKNTLAEYKNEEYYYKFITFNYTSILDKIVDITKKRSATITTHNGNGNGFRNTLSNIIHIHGTLNEEMILGVNDEKQIKNDELLKNKEFLDTFIKVRMNAGIGQRKSEKAKQIIQESHIICIFGMSIGNTDQIWWEEIIKWLGNNKKNLLIVYWKGLDEKIDKRLPSKIIRLNNQIKQNIINKGKGEFTDELNEIQNRILISYNSEIFSFPRLKN